ncbi:hypoxia-inducible factor 1-alpha isoform X2 [Hyposmocoma kahamanoa]|uniref:hypoxia-inducible factor 1-alpha isoform X2 n=1 Tax=Hyposmocoma kahamanoa TaxID=1477025 RepID=UPI000E6D826A|nr:hypoxia-inducible factor 1-alpha isoform X2 [Hyposmocoma kahamanoa]
MFTYGEQAPQTCAIDGFQDNGWMQCAVNQQWPMSKNTCFVYPPVQCYNYPNVPLPQPQYYPMQERRTDYVQHPIYPNLPCQQTRQWDYDSMCYNVDGQPCQFTSVVDLEDFMNNEKRKEKSRVAARCRRTKEMQIFAELTAALPAKKEEVVQLDKASVMRLAISYLRVRDVVSLLPKGTPEEPKIENPKDLEEISSELSYMKALDGFVMALSQQGDIVYCSENIADHLGVSQMEIMGQSVFEFTHPCDHDEIREALRSTNKGRRELLLRFKCTLTSKGRNVHIKSASYKVIHVTGHMLSQDKENERNNNDDSKTNEDDKKSNGGALVAVGRPIPHPSNIEIPLDCKTFLSQHSLDMKFTYTDKALLNILGFEPEELAGRSLYDYHHAADSAMLAQQFKSLFSKGQCETGQYRFLAKTGGYAWVQTQATVITDKQQKSTSVVCVNYVISGIECKDEVFAAHQVQHADLKPVLATSTSVPALAPICAPLDLPNGAIVAAIPPEDERPIPVTELIFAPRKKEMNKGFLMFSQDEGLTMLKDEPEDLTHLAPTAGDACIPLENSPFDMFDEFILNDNYCSLLGDDLANGSPVDALTPDSLLMSSPEPQENDSSCERSSLLTDLSLDAFENGRSDDIEDGNSPFIPTSDELPVLEPAVMWGALPDSVSLARPQPSETQSTSPAPALQCLLAAPPTGPPPQDLITNIYSDQGLIPSRSVSTWDTGVKRILKQEEEPSAKRVKRSPSPPQMEQKSLQQQMNNRRPNNQVLNTPEIPQSPLNKNIPIPVINLLQAVPNTQIIRTPISNNNNNNVSTIRNINDEISPLTKYAMSPLSLNIGSPMYSLPPSPNTSNYNSPNYSPAMSPVHRDRVLSPYSTPQSLSPVSRFQKSPGNVLLSPAGVIQGSDPYLNNKMQPSPGFPLQSNDLLLESSMSLSAPDFWTEPDVLTGTSDLLTAFDDVKLV